MVRQFWTAPSRRTPPLWRFSYELGRTATLREPPETAQAAGYLPRPANA
jgi:hypothetical protein